MTIARLIFAVIFIVAGALHFYATGVYLRIMPPWLPAPASLVLFSGACEIAGGVGLLCEPTRRMAAWGLVALLIAVMPANYQMVAGHATRWQAIPLWLLWARLPLQIPLIYWAWLYTRR